MFTAIILLVFDFINRGYKTFFYVIYIIWLVEAGNGVIITHDHKIMLVDMSETLHRISFYVK